MKKRLALLKRMKTRDRLPGTLKLLVALCALFLGVVGIARADSQSPWISVYSGKVYTVATTPSATPAAAKAVFIGTNVATLKSTDGGITWATVLGQPTNYLAADPAAAGVVYAATPAGLQKTTDYGQTWSVINAAIKQVVVVSPFSSQVIFGDNFKSVDGGATWTAMAGLPNVNASTNPYPHLKASRDPANPGALLYMDGASPYKSTDNGQTWVRLSFSNPDSVEIDPVDSRYLYVGGCSSSFRIFNGVQSSLSLGSHIHGLVVDPAAHNRIYAVSDNYSGNVIRVSEDYGATWTPASGGFPGADIPEGRMTIDADSGIIYLPTLNKGLFVKNSRCLDADHDGASPTGGLCGPVDCDDASATRSPFNHENCFDGLDNNCTMSIDFADPWCVSTCVDDDGDGHFPLLCGGDDPNNADPTIYPGAPELCDDKDNNGNGTIDEGCTRYTYYYDNDTDGFGNPGNTTLSSFTTPPAGYVTDNTDCYDWDAGTHPGAPDVCGDGLDNDCNGTPDQGCPTFTYFIDADYDGYGDPNQPFVTTLIEPYGGISANNLDCNDQTSYINPGAVEECDWADNNCDGAIDEGCAHTEMIWGDNAKGQLGDGTTTDRKSPVTLAKLSPVAVAAGDQHSLAVNNDGAVWAWGINDSGQLGDGTTTTRKSPVKISGLSGVIAVSAGLNHSLALKNNGTVWAWGGNGNGQLGDGTTTTRKTPVQVYGLFGVIAVSAGSYHNLAIKNDGTVWAWGNNGSGRLGDGTAITRKTPVQVDVLSGLAYVTAVAAGGEFSLALDSNGSVWAWGDNCKGQLGDGTTTTRKTPVQASGLVGYYAVGIAAGTGHGLARGGDSSIMAWGDNAKGQLGDGTTTTRKTPVLIAGLSGVTVIAAGGTHSLALDANGSFWAWGNNSDGQLGDGTTTTRKRPVVVPGQSDAIFLAAGGAHSITLR